jgi:hypothetical protein
MSNGIAKCLEKMDFVPESCKFIKRCPAGQVRSEKTGKCVKGASLNSRLREIRNQVNVMRQTNTVKNRGLIMMKLKGVMKDAGTPNRERIQALIDSAGKITSREKRNALAKETRRTATEAKKIEKQKKANASALKKAIAAAKKEAKSAAVTEKKTLRERKAANKGTKKKGISLNSPLVPLTAIAQSGLNGANRSGSTATSVLAAVESAVKSMTKSPSVERFSPAKKTSPVTL